MDRDRNIHNLGLVNLLLLLAVGGAAQVLTLFSGSVTGQAGLVFIALGALVAAVSYFQMHLESRERLEKLEFEELKKTTSGTALFTQQGDTFPARRAREQFGKWFIPGFTIGLFLLQGAAAYSLWKWTGQAPVLPADKATISMALAALFSLLFFIRGKYVAGRARWEKQGLLRPGASFLLLGSVVMLLMAVTEAVAYFDYPQVDIIVARGLCVILGLVAVETLIALIFEIYRPRLKGQEMRLLYESRLLGLLSQPGGLITTAAQALDYQFGFKVSETWFYRFFEKALAWILLLQLGALGLSTCFVVIEATQQGVLERWGRPVAGRAVLEPGFHFKYPWPIDKVLTYPSRQVLSFYIGFVPDLSRNEEKIILWTRPHFKEEYNMLVASRERTVLTGANAADTEQVVPVNLLSVNLEVQYRIKDLQAWVYNHTAPGDLLEKLANREVTRYLVNVDIDTFMSAGRMEAASRLKTLIQQRADEERMGAEIIFVGLQGVHPPVKVAPDYEAVIGAYQEQQSNILSAKAYWAEKIPQAYAEATNLVLKAHSESLAKVTTAAAEATQYHHQLTAYQAGPEVYKQRTYLETLVKAIAPARKYVVAATNTQDVIWLNLEDKIRQDLLDVPLPAGRR